MDCALVGWGGVCLLQISTFGEYRNEVMKAKSYENVWDAISDSPEQAENMKLRSLLMMQIAEYVRSKNLEGKEVQRMLGLTQPRVSYLLNGKIDKFSLDALVVMASRAGLHVNIAVEAA